jgi:hypothetical protein
VEDFEQADVQVPETCCVLNFAQDRDLSKVDPQKPEPKDARRCQEDAEGNKDGSDNLNGRVSPPSLCILIILLHNCTEVVQVTISLLFSIPCLSEIALLTVSCVSPFQGCFAALLDFIWLEIDLIIGLGVTVAILQVCFSSESLS